MVIRPSGSSSRRSTSGGAPQVRSCRMTPVVVDTDVISFLFKNDTRAQSYLSLLRDRELLVSFMTEAELEQWILLAKWGSERVQRFRAFMNAFASVPSSRDLILKWADVMVTARAADRPGGHGEIIARHSPFVR